MMSTVGCMGLQGRGSYLRQRCGRRDGVDVELLVFGYFAPNAMGIIVYQIVGKMNHTVKKKKLSLVITTLAFPILNPCGL